MANKTVALYKSNKTGESKTLREWSNDSGISFNTLYCRIKDQKLNIDEAIEASNKVHPMEAIMDPMSGETHSLQEWSNITGIPENTIYRRIVRQKWPVDKALYSKKFDSPNRKARPKNSYTHIDLTGERYGYLTVIRRDDEDYTCMCNGKPKSEWKWLCKCDCGNIVSVVQHNLRNGHCTSCGCMNTNNFIDMTGQKIGHLTVISREPDRIISGERVVYWKCKCDCGRITSAQGKELRNGHRTSCGCGINSTKHGLHGTRIYQIYQNMVARCTNEKSDAYARYGGRGITICDEWIDPDRGLLNFYNWTISNGYDDSLTIDRIDNDKGYSPDNCRWADMKTQSNNRSNNVYITYNGIKKTATEWGEELGINPATLMARHSKEWSDVDIIETPVGGNINKVCSSSGDMYTISEWSLISGLRNGLIYDRIYRQNWPVDRALLTGATNPEIFNHVSPASAYAFQNPSYVQPSTPPAVYYVDVLGRYYTPEEWDARQAIFFD